MKDKVDRDQTRVAVQQAEEHNAVSEADAEWMEPVSGGLPEKVSKRTNAMRPGFVSRLPALPRFSDAGQQHAAGNIVKFLAVLLALTLIARGTSGATLAKVELSNPARGEIVEAVTGTATVSARDTLDITVPEGMTIAEMMVGTGQTVKNGEPVARFDPEEVEDKLIRETANLDKLLFDLEKIERAEDANAAALETARRNLQRAQEDYDTVKAQGEIDVADAKEALEEAWAEQAEDPDAAVLDTARRNLQRAQEDYSTVRLEGMSETMAAREALTEVQDKTAESVDSTAMNTARRSHQRAQADYNTVKAQGDSDVAPFQTALNTAKAAEEAKRTEWENAADPDKDAAEQAYKEAQAETEKAQAAYNAAKKKADENNLTAKRRVEDAESSYNKAKADYEKSERQAEEALAAEIERAQDALDAAKDKAEANLLNAQRRVEDAEVALVKAEKDYSKNSEQASDALQNEIDRTQDAFDAAKDKAEANLLSAQRRVEDAEVSLTKAEQDYSKSSQQTSDTAAQNRIGTASLRLDISDQKSIVDELQMLIANDYVLYTDLEGVVSAVKPEGSVTNKDPLISFMDGAKGFEAQLKVDKSDADMLAVGDECQVTTSGGSMYYNPTVTGTVSGIAPPDENDMALITVRLPEGDWTTGQRVELQAVQSRDTYDLCVPLSALRADNTGYYLLAVEQKSTVLGVENVVIKVPVTLNASDDDNAAVQGPVDRNSKIISGSNKTVAQGDRVRVSTQ